MCPRPFLLVASVSLPALRHTHDSLQQPWLHEGSPSRCRQGAGKNVPPEWAEVEGEGVV